jgi:hypothetical protein
MMLHKSLRMPLPPHSTPLPQLSQIRRFHRLTISRAPITPSLSLGDDRLTCLRLVLAVPAVAIALVALLDLAAVLGLAGDYTTVVAGAGFPGPSLQNPANPFGGPDLRSGSLGGSNGRASSQNPLSPPLPRTTSSGRTGGLVEERIVVGLMPEKEGLFFFQHHNYEVSSLRRGSKVIRRYSDFAWLLECLYKRYPFRALPLLPPKRPASKYPSCCPFCEHTRGSNMCASSENRMADCLCSQWQPSFQ